MAEDQGEPDVRLLDSLEALAIEPMTVREVLVFFLRHQPEALKQLEAGDYSGSHLALCLPREPLVLHVAMSLVVSELPALAAQARMAEPMAAGELLQ